MKISNRLDSIEPSQTFSIANRLLQLKKEGCPVIAMNLGEASIDTPINIASAGIEAIHDGHTRYTPIGGTTRLKKAIINKFIRDQHTQFEKNEILVSSGSKQSISNALLALLNVGDEVIIPNPSFVSYSSIIRACRGIPIEVELSEEDSFKINPKKVKSLVTNKTKAIIINSPNNPTGSVLTKSQIKEIYDIAEKFDLVLISDEVYGRMIFSEFENSFFSPSQIDHCKERTILIHSFSKTFAMTGWRIGAVTGPEILIKKMGLLFETITSCVPPFIQIAAAEVLDAGPQLTKDMINEYQLRRDLLVNGLNSIEGICCNKSEGTFYAFANIKSINASSEIFSNDLLNKQFIATCPGVYFGKNGEGFVRFCFANSRENIKKAIDRLQKKFNK